MTTDVMKNADCAEANATLKIQSLIGSNDVHYDVT